MVTDTKAKWDAINTKSYNVADLASKDWFRRQCQDPAVRMYFYLEPGEISFYLGPDPLNDSWELARPETVSIGMSTNQVCDMIQRLARHLPILDPS